MKLSRLIGWALAGGCVLLLVVAGLLGTGVLTDIDADSEADAVPERPLPEGGTAGQFELPPLEEYAVVAQRPLFNEDRRPAPPDEGIVDAGEADGEALPSAPLDVSVKGIIISPDVRLAILTDNRTKETVRVQEGMPLEGDLAAWTLTEIQPRKLVFDGESMGTAEVELQVHTQALAGGPPPQARRESPAEPQQAEESGDQEAEPQTTADAEARAEEIRRRVAERRAQLRAEAERRRQQQAEEQ